MAKRPAPPGFYKGRNMSNEKDNNPYGCAAALLALFIVMPMYYILQYWILSTLEAPRWCWVLFAIYLPTSIIIHLLTAMAKLAGDKS